MPKPLLIIRNITHEGPGLLESALTAHGLRSRNVDLSKGESFPDPCHYSALVVLGGPQSANDDTQSMQEQLRRIRTALDAGLPYFGICLGMQALVKAAGGEVVRCQTKETGFFDPLGAGYRMELSDEGRRDPLFEGLMESIRVFQLHGETVELPPSGVELLATGGHCRIQAVRAGSNAYGLQCHAELTREMFSEWIGIDADLKKMESAELLQQFDAFRDEYSATGLKLLENFLRIAGLA
ncbi:MAG: type 1 glutamine amidotransferase [Chlorobiaceae bacterium]